MLLHVIDLLRESRSAELLITDSFGSLKAIVSSERLRTNLVFPPATGTDPPWAEGATCPPPSTPGAARCGGLTAGGTLVSPMPFQSGFPLGQLSLKAS